MTETTTTLCDTSERIEMLGGVAPVAAGEGVTAVEALGRRSQAPREDQPTREEGKHSNVPLPLHWNLPLLLN